MSRTVLKLIHVTPEYSQKRSAEPSQIVSPVAAFRCLFVLNDSLSFQDEYAFRRTMFLKTLFEHFFNHRTV